MLKLKVKSFEVEVKSCRATKMKSAATSQFSNGENKTIWISELSRRNDYTNWSQSMLKP